MPLKYPCLICLKFCKSNQNCIFCDLCKNWIHLKCTSLTVDQFNELTNSSDGPDNTYCCPSCILKNLPTFDFFNDFDDDFMSDTESHSSPLRGLDFASLPAKQKRKCTYKYPCSVCEKPCKNNQKSILCETCNLWVHLNCSDLTASQFDFYAESNDSDFPYKCPSCTLLSSSADLSSHSRSNMIPPQLSSLATYSDYNSEHYHDILTVDSLVSNDTDNILIIHVNIVSLCKNHDSLATRIPSK